MHFDNQDPLVLKNAQIVTATESFAGWVVVEHGLIAKIGRGAYAGAGVDFEGDGLIPGLIEVHTDHLESHFMPRPSVQWHAGAAVLAYDAQIAAAGITTVFDSLRIGSNETREDHGDDALPLADALVRAGEAGLLRAEHLTHLRCEVAAPNVVEGVEVFLRAHPVQLISLMDHTPGQRQFRDLDKFNTYYAGKYGRSAHDLAQLTQHLQSVGAERAAAFRPRVVALARAHGIILASHCLLLS